MLLFLEHVSSLLADYPKSVFIHYFMWSWQLKGWHLPFDIYGFLLGRLIRNWKASLVLLCALFPLIFWFFVKPSWFEGVISHLHWYLLLKEKIPAFSNFSKFPRTHRYLRSLIFQVLSHIVITECLPGSGIVFKFFTPLVVMPGIVGLFLIPVNQL